jgi:hypothetical protein
MKRTPASALAAIVLLSIALLAQPTPDFSGNWTLDTCAITQSVGQVRIETTRGNERENVLYALTKSRASSNPGASGQSEAYWDGDQLITVTQRTVSGQTVTVKESRTLSPTGADMTVETTVIVQHGYSMPGAKNYGTSRDVFIRARP